MFLDCSLPREELRAAIRSFFGDDRFLYEAFCIPDDAEHRAELEAASTTLVLANGIPGKLIMLQRFERLESSTTAMGRSRILRFRNDDPLADIIRQNRATKTMECLSRIGALGGLQR